MAAYFAQEVPTLRHHLRQWYAGPAVDLAVTRFEGLAVSRHEGAREAFAVHGWPAGGAAVLRHEMASSPQELGEGASSAFAVNPALKWRVNEPVGQARRCAHASAQRSVAACAP